MKEVDASLLKDPELQKTLSQPTHKAMLFILESIIRNPMTVNDLVSKLSKPAHQEIRKACNADKPARLEAFLRANTSVFSIDAEGIVRPTDLLQVDAESSPQVDSTTNRDSSISSESQQSGSDKKSSNKTVSSSNQSMKGGKFHSKLYQPPCLKSRIELELSANQNGVLQRIRNPLIIDPSTSLPNQPTSSIGDKTDGPGDGKQREMEAVRYFERCMLKKGERWLPIKSLAGHLSQASEQIRNVVGHQIDFEKFLLKYPNIFEIQGNLVSLKDQACAAPIMRTSNFRKSGRQAVARNRNSMAGGLHYPNPAVQQRATKPNRPMSLVMLNPISLDQKAGRNCNISNSSNPTTPLTPRKQMSGVVQVEGICLEMTAKEYQAVMYLRKLLSRSNNGLSTIELMTQLAEKAPDAILETIGQTEVELEGFLDIKSDFFESVPGVGSSDHSFVINKRFTKKINVVIVGGCSPDGSTRTLTNKCGRVAHVAKQWGIIDLGRHEHVFFDKSIFRNVDDLQRHFFVSYSPPSSLSYHNLPPCVSRFQMCAACLP
ncbi:hypothetical protein Ciccas_011782 [Cichlidogyrus casuarinus]|uniref:Egal-1 winged helix domain-containing protein n=1 Tax=Cichlidogyrus casuarinus TaxID=1844966 RepID=A0ABD2PR61_9PLAT